MYVEHTATLIGAKVINQVTAGANPTIASYNASAVKIYNAF
jgi:hypothetical protein